MSNSTTKRPSQDTTNLDTPPAPPARYIPALNRARLTPLYDPAIRLAMRETELKRRLIEQAAIAPGQRVLDLGCGTGTLMIAIKQRHPEATVVGVDGDHRILEIAREKAARADVDLQFEAGMAYALPYPDAAFDRVVSSLVLHHIATPDKYRTAREVFRVLRPGGEFHVLDFAAPRGALAHAIALVLRHLEEVADNIDGRLPGMIAEAGFDPVEAVGHAMSIFGTLSYLRAVKPGDRG